MTMRLAVRTPFAGSALLDFLAYHLVPGVEVAGPGWYARTLDLPHGPGTVRLELADEPAGAGDRVRHRDVRAAGPARHRGGRRAGPPPRRRRLRPGRRRGALRRRPGDRPARPRGTPGCGCPGQVDGDEIAVRTVIGQQVSVTGARTVDRPAGGRARPAGRDRRPRADPPLPGRRDAGRARPRGAADAAGSRGRALVALCARARLRRHRAGPRPRPRRRTPGAAGAARHRPVDGRLRRAAGARPPRRLPADRHRRPRRARRPRARPGRGGRRQRRLAPLALLRPAAPLDHPDAPGRDRRDRARTTEET